MTAPFALHAEPAHNLLRLRIVGAMEAGDVDALFRERARLTAGFACPPGHHRAIVDVRDAPMQPEEALERIGLLSEDLPLDHRRAAIVHRPEAGATRLQFRELGALYNLCLFDRLDDAERWIRL